MTTKTEKLGKQKEVLTAKVRGKGYRDIARDEVGGKVSHMSVYRTIKKLDKEIVDKATAQYLGNLEERRNRAYFYAEKVLRKLDEIIDSCDTQDTDDQDMIIKACSGVHAQVVTLLKTLEEIDTKNNINIQNMRVDNISVANSYILELEEKGDISIRNRTLRKALILAKEKQRKKALC